MRVLFINTSEQVGGASIAAKRLMHALGKRSIDVNMLVYNKQTNAENVKQISTRLRRQFNFLFERLVIFINNRFSRKNLFKVSIANTGTDITQMTVYKEADIIHLHWINQGMLSLKDIRKIIDSGKRIVWTMHDMWTLTGICHYPYSCNRYEKECGRCYFLMKPGEHDLSYRTLKKKKNTYSNSDIHFVAVSSWVVDKAKRSTLLKDKKISIIPNTLSLDSFTIYDKKSTRQELGLPEGKYIIVFGSVKIDDDIKGFSYLTEAIKHLIGTDIPKDQLHLVLFGGLKSDVSFLDSIPVTYTYYGKISDTSLLAKLYSSADVTVTPSLYETFGQTIIEAMACGCIPVSFGNSGQRDIISHKVNGYLAEYLSVTDLSNGIKWALTEAPQQIPAESLRENVLCKYSEDTVGEMYINLYNSILRN